MCIKTKCICVCLCVYEALDKLLCPSC